MVPIVPFGSDSLAEAAPVARALGERIWSELRVPVHFYGAAGGSTLAQIRSANPPPPDLGDRPHPTAGVVSVGAREPLVAYNLLLAGVSAAEASAVAGRLRESAGGVRGVQALVFAVAGGTQLSMNLTRLRETAPALAREEARRRLPAGGSIVAEEIVGLCPAWAASGCPAADGVLLEGRLAAAAAHAAAGRHLQVAGASSGARRCAPWRLGWKPSRLPWPLSASPTSWPAASGRPRCGRCCGRRAWSATSWTRCCGWRRWGFGRPSAPTSSERFPERVAALDRRLER